MNERIKELAKEAGLKVNPDGEIGPAFFGSVDAGYRNFAELIIRECMKQAHSVGDLRGANDDMIYGADYAAVQISKHFGVKE